MEWSLRAWTDLTLPPRGRAVACADPKAAAGVLPPCPRFGAATVLIVDADTRLVVVVSRPVQPVFWPTEIRQPQRLHSVGADR
ncbi:MULTISPECIES: hypothetical protein [unclassified Streptomyces]|uniref:Uncharacterized protein n=1 Tax=Streptomyces rhizosphaericus TaxID=114699 RepID=A0A6G4AW51_9ACTN|nr:hypothetical protein [Streptomyces sp. DASNCL29]NEW76889.1 hypothetical protein [Streptomyces rhizosphaericus]TMU98319.1 hypothetical protein FGK60_11085 [Streptomyces sp. DASNCL29]